MAFLTKIIGLFLILSGGLAVLGGDVMDLVRDLQRKIFQVAPVEAPFSSFSETRCALCERLYVDELKSFGQLKFFDDQ